MKSLGRLFAWWPGFDKDLEAMVKSCFICQQHRPSPTTSPLHPWSWPTRPWARVHIDYAGPFLGQRFFVVIDAHSKWLEAFIMPSTTSAVTIEKLRTLFATLGIPEMIVSDNSTNFTSEEFHQFCVKNGIKHVTTAPYHPSSNGLAERALRILKEGLVKVTTGSVVDCLAWLLFAYQIVPLELTGCSPAELMFGRRLRSCLDLLKPDLEDQIGLRQEKMKRNHDSNRPHLSYDEGSPVFVKNFSSGPDWLPGHIIQTTGPVSVKVQPQGSHLVWREHFDQIRPRVDQPTQALESSMIPSTDSLGVNQPLESPIEPPSDQLESQQNGSPPPAGNQAPRYPSWERRLPERLAYKVKGGEDVSY